MKLIPFLFHEISLDYKISCITNKVVKEFVWNIYFWWKFRIIHILFLLSPAFTKAVLGILIKQCKALWQWKMSIAHFEKFTLRCFKLIPWIIHAKPFSSFYFVLFWCGCYNIFFSTINIPIELRYCMTPPMLEFTSESVALSKHCLLADGNENVIGNHISIDFGIGAIINLLT